MGAEFLLLFPSDGERDDFLSDAAGQKIKISTGGMGLYLVGKTPGKVYAKARAGLGFSDVTYSASGFEDESDRTSGLSYGVGAGVTTSMGMRVELEHVVFPEADDALFSAAKYDQNVTFLSFNWDIK